MFPVAAGAQQTTETDDNTVGDNEVVSLNYISAAYAIANLNHCMKCMLIHDLT